MSTFNRRMQLLAWLKQGKRITLSKIKEVFGVSKRTALNDIAYLSGYPIRSVSGRNGGYEWTGDRELTLTEQEVERIVTMIDEAGIVLIGAAGAVVVKMRTFVAREK